MCPRHRYIINPQIRIMAPSHAEYVFIRIWLYNVDNAGSVLLLVEALEDHIVTAGLFVVDEVVSLAATFHH